MKPKLENPSLYERVMRVIESINNIEAHTIAIETLHRELNDILRARGILFPPFETQAVQIYRDTDYIIISFYLLSVEVWVKIYRDGYVDARIYPILNCSCGI